MRQRCFSFANIYWRSWFDNNESNTIYKRNPLVKRRLFSLALRVAEILIQLPLVFLVFRGLIDLGHPSVNSHHLKAHCWIVVLVSPNFDLVFFPLVGFFSEMPLSKIVQSFGFSHLAARLLFGCLVSSSSHEVFAENSASW